jgi:hypothetical protein
MACRTPGCLGNYDFNNIAFYARKRFIEGYDTVTLLEQAASEREKEEIALVAMLDLDENIIRDLELCCRYAKQCKVTICRQKLKSMIEEDLANRPLLN